MIHTPRIRSHRLLAGLIVAASIAAGCGGGGGAQFVGGPAPGSPTSTPAPGGGGATTATATVVIHWPARSSSASSVRRGASQVRRPDYVSNATKSVSIAVNGGTPQTVDNPNLQPGNAATESTTVPVTAPVGNDTFVVGAYDQTGGQGNLLGKATVPFTVASGAANLVPVTLNGNLAKIACAGNTSNVSGTSPTLTQVGVSGGVTLIPEDADNNAIVTPGNVPSLQFAAKNAAQGSVSAGASANLFVVTIAVTNTPVEFDASGTNLAGSAVTLACNITRIPALYVVNRIGGPSPPPNGPAQSSSITVYPATASGNATPLAAIAGSNANAIGTQFVAVDGGGNIFTTNLGPMPGATFGPTSGYVAIYAPGASGNVAPIGYIPNLNTPEGIAFDSHGNLWVMQIDRITEYPPSADGLTAAASASTTITGSDTDLFSCYGVYVDPTGQIFGACSNILDVFAAGSSGNATPALIQPITAPGAVFNSRSWLGVTTDSSGNILAPASNQNLNMVDIYASSAPGPAASPGTTPAPNQPSPSGESAGTGYSQPLDIVVDSGSNYYVSNLGNNSVEVFAGFTMFQTGVASSTISGASTGLAQPFGIYVR